MVEIREADENEVINEQPSSSSQSNQNQQNSNASTVSYIEYCKRDPLSAVIAWLRIITLFFIFQYLLSLFGLADNKTSFNKVLIASAASNGLRLYQRVFNPMPRFRNFNEIMATLFLEDSFHYLIYCLPFSNCSPVTMPLFPIAGFALFNTVVYLLGVAKAIGQEHSSLAIQLNQLKEKYNKSLLYTIACVEIFTFPVFCAMILTGKASIMYVPCYYFFLRARYASRRNPNFRVVSYQLKQSLLNFTTTQQCPGFAKNGIIKFIALVERLA